MESTADIKSDAEKLVRKDNLLEPVVSSLVAVAVSLLLAWLA